MPKTWILGNCYLLFFLWQSAIQKCHFVCWRHFLTLSYRRLANLNCAQLPILWKSCITLQVSPFKGHLGHQDDGSADFRCEWLYKWLFNSYMIWTFSFNAVQRKGYMDLQELAWEDSVSCCYGSTLPNDSSCTLPCSWAAADPSTFLIRGKSYLKDRQKVRFFSSSYFLGKQDENLKSTYVIFNWLNLKYLNNHCWTYALHSDTKKSKRDHANIGKMCTSDLIDVKDSHLD